MPPPKPITAVDLVIAKWTRRRDELAAIVAHLEAAIDHYQGPRGPELNRLVEKYIVRRSDLEQTRRNLDRVQSGRAPITRR